MSKRVNTSRAKPDMRLRLTFEKGLLGALPQTRHRIHDEFCVGGRRNGRVGKQIESVRRFPFIRRVVRPDLQQNQIVLAMKLRRHLHECFPIYAFVINAKPAPIRIVLKNLKEQLIDAGAGFARAGVASDEPATAKIFACPRKAFQPDDEFAFGRFCPSRWRRKRRWRRRPPPQSTRPARAEKKARRSPSAKTSRS